MFVTHKQTDKIFEVYEIQSDKNGYPKFLIYENNQWKWMSAKHFRPTENIKGGQYD